MNIRRGKDGKVYPATRKPAELARLVGIEHTLACTEGLSRRQVQARLLTHHATRRSLGAISQDLSRYESCRTLGFVAFTGQDVRTAG